MQEQSNIIVGESMLNKFRKQAEEYLSFLKQYNTTDEKIDDNEESVEIETIFYIDICEYSKPIDCYVITSASCMEKIVPSHAETLKRCIDERKNKKCYVRISPEVTENRNIEKRAVGMYTRLIFV